MSKIGPVFEGISDKEEAIVKVIQLLRDRGDTDMAGYFSAELEIDRENQFLDWQTNLLNHICEYVTNNHAEHYIYFGAHPGNKDNYGFWVDEKRIKREVSGDWVKMVDGLSDVPEDWDGEVFVKHKGGQITYYKPVIAFEPVWTA